MGTVPTTIQKMMENLNLTDNQDEAARAQRDRVLEQVKGELFIKSTFISGSFGRRTSTRPLHDIDQFLELEPKRHGGPDKVLPATLLAELKAAVEATNHGKTAKLQARSVNIEFSGTGIGYDFVPAFQVEEGVYKIPDLGKNGWVKTNPRKHKAYTQEANERAEGMGLGLIRAVKQWNNKTGKNLRSFHLEVMIAGLLQEKPESYAEGLRMLFEKLRWQVDQRCPDPAGLSGFVDEGTDPSKRLRAKDGLEVAFRAAEKARELELRGDHDGAHKLWRQIFGDVYPAVGAEPKVAPLFIDAPKSRFG
jgi:hypothetical protein